MAGETLDVQQLAKKVKLFEAIVNRTSDGIIVFNHQMEAMFANEAAGEMMGLPANELRGKPLSTFIPADLRAKHEKLVHLFTHSTEERQELDNWRELRCARLDGSLFPCRISVQKFSIYGNMAFIVTLQDMTEYYAADQKSSDAELTQFQLEQQKRCTANTLQLSLEAAITKIAKNAQALKENIQIKTVQNSCQTIMNAAFSALTISQRAAYFSEDGNNLDSTNIDALKLIDRSIYGIFERVRAIIDPVASSKHLKTVWEVPSNAKDFRIHSCATVEQIFFNIAEHAVSNSIGGEIMVRVPQLQRLDDQRIEIHFHCSISHFGVPQFIMDQTLGASPSDRLTGINTWPNQAKRLRLANYLTNRQGGSMRVITHPSEGTEIFIRLCEYEQGARIKKLKAGNPKEQEPVKQHEPVNEAAIASPAVSNADATAVKSAAAASKADEKTSADL